MAPVCLLPGAGGPIMNLVLAKNTLDSPAFLLRACVSLWKVKNVSEYHIVDALKNVRSLLFLTKSVWNEYMYLLLLRGSFILEFFKASFHVFFSFDGFYIYYYNLPLMHLCGIFKCAIYVLIHFIFNVNAMTHCCPFSTSSYLKLYNGEPKPTQTISCMCYSMLR